MNGDGALRDNYLIVARCVLGVLVALTLAVVLRNWRHWVMGVLSETFRTPHGHLTIQEVHGLIADHMPSGFADTSRIYIRSDHPPADHFTVLVVHGYGPTYHVYTAE